MERPGTDVVVTWSVPAGEAELRALDLWDRGATAVGESAPDGGTVTLTASFPTPAAARLVAAEVGARAREVDRSWQDAWRDHAEAVRVDGGLVIAPAWRPVDLPDGSRVLRIDPGPCFGSGSHPSTRLLLGLLATDAPRDLDVVDVGAGSGILAVAAAVLGARHVEAVDIDPSSPAAVDANAAANSVAHLVTASTTPVDHLAPGRFDLALVNVTAGVHVELAAGAVRAVRPGGRLLLAGLLPGQWRHVAPSYRGCRVEALPALDGWTGAVLRVPQASSSPASSGGLDATAAAPAPTSSSRDP